MSQKDGTKDTPTKKPAAKKNAKPNAWQRFIKGLAAIPQRIRKSVLNTVAELKKVTWPTKQSLINYSLVVIVFMVLMAILVGALDLGTSALIKLIIRV
jgi:preprotein translocase subunit SecE